MGHQTETDVGLGSVLFSPAVRPVKACGQKSECAPTMPKPQVEPRAYTLENNPLPFSRSTWFRWEREGYVKLLRVGAKTLISAETIDGILSGEIKLPRNPGMDKAPKPHARPGRKRIHPKREQSPSAAE